MYLRLIPKIDIMKIRTVTFITGLFIAAGLAAQVPREFNYQAIARDNSGNEIVNTALQVRIAILTATDPDVVLWEEEHSVTTTDYGMITLIVGDPSASRVDGLLKDFEDIDWSVTPLYLRTNVYYNSTWLDMGNARLVSVPYAMRAGLASGLSMNTLQTEGITFAIVGGDVSNPDALFEVRRSDGEVMFGVYNDGVEINVPYNMLEKGPKGGFAIGGFDARKKGTTEEYFRITRDSTRIYVNQNSSKKGSKGGFAIGGFDGTKTEPVDFLNLTYKNYFIGQEAGESISTGMHNAFFGYQAGYNLTEGDNNVFLGHQTGFTTTNGHENVFIGNRAGYTASGYDNIFIGNAAGEESSGTTHSTFIGNEAGWNVTGDDNIAIGDRAGHNTYSGSPELMQTVILGIDAGRNFTGSNNTILGYGAGSKWGSSATGNNNTFVGASAGGGGTDKLGNDNVCLGYEAGYGQSGDGKLFIGNSTDSYLISGLFEDTGDGVAPFILLDADVEVAGDLNVAGTLTYPSDLRYKTGLEPVSDALSAVNRIDAVYYRWKTDEYPEEKFTDKRQIGFIAQNVEEFFPELVRTDRDGYKSLDYGKMTVVLLQAVKEQQETIEKQKEENNLLTDRLNSMEVRLNQLESIISATQDQ